jgi:hypothetical protein
VLFAKDELARGLLDPWVRERTHWAVSPWLANEVRTLGIECEYVQASFVPPVSAHPLPENFSVLVYAPSTKRAALYGLDLILEVAKKLPHIEFNLVGFEEKNLPTAPTNLRVYGKVEPSSFYRQTTVLWRPVRHDGLSFMVLEALAHGRHVLYSYAFPGCIHVADAAEACSEIERLRDLHAARTLELNETGRQIIARDFDPRVVRARLLDRWQRIILDKQDAVAPASAQVPFNL